MLPQGGRQGSKDGYNFIGFGGDVRRGALCPLVSEVKGEVTFTNLRMKGSHLR